MLGLILALLVGFVLVAVAVPVVLWGLSMETLKEQAALSHERRESLAAPASCRGGLMACASCIDLADAVSDDDRWSCVSEIRKISVAA